MCGQPRKPTLKEALATLAVVVSTILLGISLQSGLEAVFLPLTLCIGIVGILGSYLGHSWLELQQGMFSGIARIVIAGLIVLLVGAIIGLWILTGTIPTLVSYGLRIITPTYFLPASFLVCVLMSLSVGTSMGTLATAGLVLMGIQAGLGLPAPLTAGAIISGAFFGDKMSPLSDSTNIAAAMGQTDLFRHIRSMMYTTVPAAALALIFYTIAGLRMVPQGSVDLDEMLRALDRGWWLHPVHLVPMAGMLILAVRRVPALLLLFLSVTFSGLWALIFQGAGLGDVFVAATVGFHSETGVEAVDSVMSRGGMTSMEPIILLLLIAGALAGILRTTGIIAVIASDLIDRVRRTGDLIVSVLLSGYATLFLTGNQPLSIILVGQTFLPTFKKRSIDTSVLTRTLEDSATIAAPLIPWSAMGAFSSQLLGVPTLEYLPYTWLPFLVPIFSIFYGYTGIAVWREKAGAGAGAGAGG